MRFGKIDYINLLPFDVFIKAYPMNSGFKKFLQLKKSYPAKLNKDFLFQRIDAGFISSIAGYYSALKHKTTNSAIISKGSVWSVIVIPNPQAEDYQSATSNALCKVLGLKGEVLIGDRALAYRYQGGEHLDMGKIWYEKKHLPFVFGRFCFNTYGDFYRRLSKEFNQKRIKIPHYILMQYSKKTSIPKEYIREYLKHIYYKIGPKEHLGLKRFYRELLFKKIKKPSRF
ncbi:menaquinone biosynthesis protein [Helicobacter sp. 12S02232-10]|uniref:MqnA/MqnD/SBP family protein n=1 Tax=Helicobacter sp. 12S02232-10 TaxID=1476197 RepID=UPI000BA52956|nr:MqnA/MqnD/SBP family protein [Helicobacter sp. 12S02232-10]PAF48246.1 menaquinone biosynthesis protein [Helicobacter sp. 12S02232-10]